MYSVTKATQVSQFHLIPNPDFFVFSIVKLCFVLQALVHCLDANLLGMRVHT